MAGTTIIEEAHTPTVAELARGGFLRVRDVARHSFAQADIDEGGAGASSALVERAGEIFRVLGIGALTAKSLHHP
jgi:hypothetical protein